MPDRAGSDSALESDQEVADELTSGDLVRVLLARRSHLLRHPWAITHVVRRLPLGPGYLALSDRLCALLSERLAGACRQCDSPVRDEPH